MGSAVSCLAHTWRSHVRGPPHFSHWAELGSLTVSPSATARPLRSLGLPFGHCVSPSVTTRPLQSLGLPFGHCVSPSVTTCPLRSLGLPFGHYETPSVTGSPLRSLRVPFNHCASPSVTDDAGSWGRGTTHTGFSLHLLSGLARRERFRLFNSVN